MSMEGKDRPSHPGEKQSLRDTFQSRVVWWKAASLNRHGAEVSARPTISVFSDICILTLFFSLVSSCRILRHPGIELSLEESCGTR